MGIEEQIKALTAATAANTAAVLALTELLSSNGITSTAQITGEPVAATKAVEAKPLAEPKADKRESITIRADKLQKLAKDKIAEGITRLQIKALITAQGAKAISELNDDQITAVYNQLEMMKGE